MVTRQQPKFAEISAQQRSASMDAMVRQIEALTAEVIELKSATHSLDAREAFATAKYDGIATDYLTFRRRTLVQRLRWIVTGR